MFEKIRIALDPIYKNLLGIEHTQRDFVTLSALILMAVPMLISVVIIGGFMLFGSNVSIDWGVLLVLIGAVVIGLVLIFNKKFTAARYTVVWTLFLFSLWGTIRIGFDLITGMGYVITILMAFLVINRRQGIVALIILFPPVVHHFLTPDHKGDPKNIWIYIVLMTLVAFLIGLLNYLNEQARDSLEQIDELQAIQQAGVSVVSSLGHQETAKKILEELQNILPHNSASVQLLREGNELEVVVGSGWSPDEVIGLRFPIPGNNPNSVVIQEGRPVILQNAPEEYPSFKVPQFNQIRSWLGVPLITKGEIIGMVAIDSTEKSYFSEEHIRVVSAFADHVAIAIENARLYDLATKGEDRLSILYRASQEVISAGSDLEFIYRSLHAAAADLMVAEAFVISLLDETEQFIDGAYLIDRGGRSENIRIPLDEGMSAKVIATGHAILEGDLLKRQDFPAEHFGDEDDVRSVVAVPFSIGNKVIGMLSAQSYQPNAYRQEELELLQLLAAQAGAAIQNARLIRRMEHMANTDSLTGVRNRRAFDTSILDEIHRAGRYGYPLALMIMDIDDFKKFNDSYGHSRGDEHLRQISKLIEDSVRDTDIVARIGGEEFSVILPHTSCQGAVELAERIRMNIEDKYKEEFQVGGTVSIGVAEYPRDGANPGVLFDAADEAMFRIKRSGKNRVGTPLNQEKS